MSTRDRVQWGDDEIAFSEVAHLRAGVLDDPDELVADRPGSKGESPR